MKNLVIIPNVSKDKSFAATNMVVDKLIELGFNVFISSATGYHKDGVVLFNELPDNTDLVVVVGGDGSVIDASHISVEKNIPMLGVNLGKVGYLTEIELDSLSTLDKLGTGEYSVIDKMLLSVEFEGKEARDERLAVNDVVISRDSLLHIADIKIEDSKSNSVKFRADGVILSTPQGSTAYAFSTGGPIVAHNVESILLAPVSPHSLFNRSVLFNSKEVIKVTNCGASPLNVSIDGRSVGTLEANEQCYVRKAEKTIKMLTFTENSMFTSLFKKMRILGDID